VSEVVGLDTALELDHQYHHPTEMEQVLAKMDTNQEMVARMGAKMDTTLKEMKEELAARMETKIDFNQEKCMSI
jgi:hypothetical protein